MHGPMFFSFFLFLKRVEWNRWSGGVHAVLLETGTKKKEKRREKDVECPLSLSIKKIKNDAQSENSTFVCV